MGKRHNPNVTVFEAEIELYKWFNENESFEISRDFPRVVLVTDTPEDDRAAILAALKEFENSLIISSQMWEDKKYWILKRTFEATPQSVDLNPAMALAVANIINEFCDITGEYADKCDPKNITEKDLTNLITICSYAMANRTEQEDDTLE
jgi:phosphatidylserine/phosphatidylglycerophosphate/cardiolipin synthase-like enzyme